MAGLFNIAAAGAPKFKELSHGISFGIMLAMTTNLAQYTFHKCAKRKYRTHLGRYWPAYSVALSAPLICADLVRHLLQDAGIWGAGSAMYNETCCDKYANGCSGFRGIECLRWPGIVLTIGCTYTGFLCMIIGVLYAVELPKKVRKQWARIRARRP